MKRIFRIGVYGLLLLVAAACARHKIIPDDTLAKIFRDAFLANAYINSQSVSTDSLNIYEPIFANYGYTTADVQYTIGNFSKRKSARLGDVVEKAITLLDASGNYYNKEVAVLDTVDNIARRAFTRTLRSDSLIRVRTLRDTSRLRIKLDVQPGEYEVRLKYLVDSLDQNENTLRGRAWLERKDSTAANAYAITMRRNQTENFTRRFTVDSTHRSLHISFVEFSGKRRKPSVTVSDLEVRYTPPTALAVDSLYRKQLDVNIFADEFFRAAIPTDSL